MTAPKAAPTNSDEKAPSMPNHIDIRADKIEAAHPSWPREQCEAEAVFLIETTDGEYESDDRKHQVSYRDLTDEEHAAPLVQTGDAFNVGTGQYFRARAMAFRVIHAMQLAIAEKDSATAAAELAYCDPTYELFDGNYAEFVAAQYAEKTRADRRLALVARLARRHPLVIETLRAQRCTDLLDEIEFQHHLARM